MHLPQPANPKHPAAPQRRQAGNCVVTYRQRPVGLGQSVERRRPGLLRRGPLELCRLLHRAVFDVKLRGGSKLLPNLHFLVYVIPGVGRIRPCVTRLSRFEMQRDTNQEVYAVI